MVKAIIQGILGKKDAPAAPTAPGNEPPDELPPLAEDAVAQEMAKTDAAKTAAAPTATPAPVSAAPQSAAAPLPAPTATAAPAAPATEPPADLPSLDFEKQISSIDFSIEEEKKAMEAQKAAQAAQSAQTAQPVAPMPAPASPMPHHDLPAEIQKAKMAKMGTETPTLPAYNPRAPIDQKQIGFFSSVLDHVKKEDGAKEKLLEGDLFNRMNNYWELKKHEIRTGASLSTREQLERDLIQCLDQLRTLEQKWQVQKMALEEDLKYLEQREREIQLKTSELKRISNEIALFKNAKPDQYFRLRNGMVLKNLHDLVDCLEVLDEATFMHHVHSGRNDFSEWIRSVFMDARLSDKLSSTKNRHEMIEVLYTTPLMQQRMRKMAKVPPSQYFYLANGVVLKSLSDLSDALKEMSDDLLHQHITYEKNDFANWVRGVFREEALASSFEKAKSRQDMIVALDVYL